MQIVMIEYAIPIKCDIINRQHIRWKFTSLAYSCINHCKNAHVHQREVTEPFGGERWESNWHSKHAGHCYEAFLFERQWLYAGMGISIHSIQYTFYPIDQTDQFQPPLTCPATS